MAFPPQNRRKIYTLSYFSVFTKCSITWRSDKQKWYSWITRSLSVLAQLFLLFEWVQGLDQNQQDSQYNLPIKALKHFPLWSLPKVQPMDLRPQLNKPSIWLMKYVFIFSLISYAYALTFVSWINSSHFILRLFPKNVKICKYPKQRHSFSGQ